MANVAGVIRYAPIVEVTEEEYGLITSVNLNGVYWGAPPRSARCSHSETAARSSTSRSGGGDMPAPMISVYALTKAR